jgi:hypothetical protein
MEPQRVDFGLDLGRLLLQQLGVRLQLFAAETSRIAARRVEPLEFELELSKPAERTTGSRRSRSYGFWAHFREFRRCFVAVQ